MCAFREWDLVLPLIAAIILALVTCTLMTGCSFLTPGLDK